KKRCSLRIRGTQSMHHLDGQRVDIRVVDVTLECEPERRGRRFPRSESANDLAEAPLISRATHVNSEERPALLRMHSLQTPDDAEPNQQCEHILGEPLTASHEIHPVTATRAVFT